MVVISRDTDGIETRETLRDIVLFVNWSPEVAGESLSLPFHHVKSLVQHFLLC